MKILITRIGDDLMILSHSMASSVASLIGLKEIEVSYLRSGIPDIRTGDRERIRKSHWNDRMRGRRRLDDARPQHIRAASRGARSDTAK